MGRDLKERELIDFITREDEAISQVSPCKVGVDDANKVKIVICYP